MSRLSRLSALTAHILSGALALVLALFLSSSARADDALYAQGEKLFRGNCASCHKPDKDMTGPALKGSRERWDGQGDIYAWIKDSQRYLKTGNAYATAIFEKWNKSVMTPAAVTDEEIDAILYYVDNYAPAAAPGDDKGASAPATENNRSGNDWLWLLVVALLLLVVILSLNSVRQGLASAVAEAEGKPAPPKYTFWGGVRAWAWNNKMFASFLGLILVVWLVVEAWGALWVIGVYGGPEVEHYRPEQPIAFDHSLHAGKDNLAIDCQYCHSGASKSRHAGIPSANVCMNCHKAVDSGTKTGTKEIAKIYAAVGWDPTTQSYTGKEEPIRWVKVHNLPDHAYFNHAQHVAVAGLECQDCHGPIDTEMTVAEQWAPLTMGWCIDCHNEREVKMAGNGYYDEVMARLMETDKGHSELKKYLQDGKITVRELGGLECAKCHY